MDVERITQSLRDYIARHRAEFNYLPTVQYQLLELASLVVTAEHYRIAGFQVQAHNLQAGRFRVKRSSAGRSGNFSWFSVSAGSTRYELHCNLPVHGAYPDGSAYVADVVVCMAGRVPTDPARMKTWKALDNQDMVTFVEAKRLVVYPMLLAQFLGIVHELRPDCVTGVPPRWRARAHFYPALVATGSLTPMSRRIVKAFYRRGFRITVVPNLEVTLRSMRAGYVKESPFRGHGPRQTALD